MCVLMFALTFLCLETHTQNGGCTNGIKPQYSGFRADNAVQSSSKSQPFDKWFATTTQILDLECQTSAEETFEDDEEKSKYFLPISTHNQCTQFEYSYSLKQQYSNQELLNTPLYILYCALKIPFVS